MSEVSICSQIDLSASDDAKLDGLHLLPCAIKFSGQANTSTYFLPQQQQDATYEAAFRGRQLYGRKICLPEAYVGHVMANLIVTSEAGDAAFESVPADSPPAEQRVLKSAGQFDTIAVWEHDRVPAEDDDEFINSLEWISVAASIHADCASDSDKAVA